MCQSVSDLCQAMNKNHHDVADMHQNFGKDITMLSCNVDGLFKTVSKLAIDQINHDSQQSGPSVASPPNQYYPYQNRDGYRSFPEVSSPQFQPPFCTDCQKIGHDNATCWHGNRQPQNCWRG